MLNVCAEEMTVPTAKLKDRQEIYYKVQGTGPSLLLLHAFPFDHTMWEPQIEELSTFAHVIAIDFPGFGQSPLAPHPLSIDSSADTVIDFLDAISIREPVIVGGLSMGGYVAMSLARRHPQRLSGLILADTRAEADNAEAKSKRAEMIALAEAKGITAVMDAMLPRLLSPTTLKSRPEVVENVRRIVLRQSITAIVNALIALRDRPDATPGLSSISVPTLVLVGEEDVLTPPSVADHLAHHIPKAKRVTIPTAGHLSNLENAPAFNHAIREFVHYCF